jgi:outer membrane receptor protein involved in Fe transport
MRIQQSKVSPILAWLLALASVVAASPVSRPAATAKRQSSSIDGVVLDQASAAVAGAEVVLTTSSLTQKILTDSGGHFHFDAPPGEIATLTITANGFTRVVKKINPANEETTHLRLVLAPAAIAEQVTVAATRTETRLSDTPVSVIVLGSNDLKTTAAVALDDALRQVAGFSLFRRSGSRTANPTAQGVSLRGLGGSGASRALVLADGVPLNDPFGGWVYWDRVPRESINQVEVLLGGASHLYGSDALGGVIDISTRRPVANTFSLTTSYGNEMTPDASLYLSGEKHGWAASLAAETFRTDGYLLVPANQSGRVDTPAGSRDASINLKLEKDFGDAGRVFGAASFFGESRENGTPLQTNRTHLRQFVLGGNWHSDEAGSIEANAYGGTQLLDQNFTSVSADRNSEALTRVQRVPVKVIGFSGKWTRTISAARRFNQTLVAGLEAREVRGVSDELAFVNGRPSSFVDAGGREHTVGVYAEDLITFGSHFFITAGGRFDHWRNLAAFADSRPITATNPTSVTSFPDRTEGAFSPQLSAVYRVSAHFSVTGSASRAFRAPTLNELYRSFRVGNVLTLANENLRAERLTSGETGARVTARNDKLRFRGTFFWNRVDRPVANVTLQTTPALITRQRQNLGRTRSNGVELQTDASLKKYWFLSAGYLFADATVVKFPGNATLEGLLIPQVARHQFTFQARYENPAAVTVGLQGRAASSQFDDDQNLFRLASYFNLDAFASRRLNAKLDIFCAIENLFNQRYEVGKTPVTTLGPPIQVRVGLRFHLGPH